ncbi:hypothetical protein [Candidatus Poriferisocius sp.]|uniref:hypothetical protein n=1 Tax=Candidatus Poriferisocius sp. TaxID=3101276 RepID=UPI003B012DBE
MTCQFLHRIERHRLARTPHSDQKHRVVRVGRAGGQSVTDAVKHVAASSEDGW